MTSEHVIAAGFALFFAAGACLELLARRGRARVPTLDAVFATVKRSSVARIVTFVVWLWIGWHFLARSS